mmetsp:Transcript_23667/g.93383  ORF Transcript_23667/g.93383 Transcript_23667/m.93383 type:complete len:118 (-) Transcript_23667:576-929(-)
MHYSTMKEFTNEDIPELPSGQAVTCTGAPKLDLINRFGHRLGFRQASTLQPRSNEFCLIRAQRSATEDGMGRRERSHRTPSRNKKIISVNYRATDKALVEHMTGLRIHLAPISEDSL